MYVFLNTPHIAQFYIQCTIKRIPNQIPEGTSPRAVPKAESCERSFERLKIFQRKEMSFFRFFFHQKLTTCPRKYNLTIFWSGKPTFPRGLSQVNRSPLACNKDIEQVLLNLLILQRTMMFFLCFFKRQLQYQASFDLWQPPKFQTRHDFMIQKRAYLQKHASCPFSAKN